MSYENFILIWLNLFVVPSKEMLEGRVGVFHYDSTCRRQLVILAEADASGSFLEGSSVPKALMDGLARSDTSYKPPDTKCSASESHELSSNQREALMKKLSKQMSKGKDFSSHYFLCAHAMSKLNSEYLETRRASMCNEFNFCMSSELYPRPLFDSLLSCFLYFEKAFYIAENRKIVWK